MYVNGFVSKFSRPKHCWSWKSPVLPNRKSIFCGMLAINGIEMYLYPLIKILPKIKHSPWKMRVGRWVSFWELPIFRGYVKFQGCMGAVQHQPPRRPFIPSTPTRSGGKVSVEVVHHHSSWNKHLFRKKPKRHPKKKITGILRWRCAI